MNSEIESLYRDIALGIYAVRPTQKWSEAIYRFISISAMSNETCTYILENGEKLGVLPSSQVTRKLATLRIEMAKLHENKHAWYIAKCYVTPEGKFNFEFDYDHLPPFHIIPSPNKWLDEFKQYPRPEQQEKIQDWIDGKAEAAEIVQRLLKLQQE